MYTYDVNATMESLVDENYDLQIAKHVHGKFGHATKLKLEAHNTKSRWPPR